MTEALARAIRCLEGIAVGDAFGQRFYNPARAEEIPYRLLPPPPWKWTDDTEMALAVLDELADKGKIEPDSLARRFVRRFDRGRGYMSGAQEWRLRVSDGVPWRLVAAELFGGAGSWGNGAAVRSGPVGAFWAGEPARAAQEARAAAQVTHAHLEGQAGAMAVAAATSAVTVPGPPRGRDLLQLVCGLLPETETRSRLERAAQMDPADLARAARELGTGQKTSAHDTVPFALFVAAHRLDSFEEAAWSCVSGLGDRDTTCAIAGGVVGMVCTAPPEWLKAREALPRIAGAS